jgi:hypothetical protein
VFFSAEAVTVDIDVPSISIFAKVEIIGTHQDPANRKNPKWFLAFLLFFSSESQPDGTNFQKRKSHYICKISTKKAVRSVSLYVQAS